MIMGYIYMCIIIYIYTHPYPYTYTFTYVCIWMYEQDRMGILLDLLYFNNNKRRLVQKLVDFPQADGHQIIGTFMRFQF